MLGLIFFLDAYMLFATVRLLYQSLVGFIYLTGVPKKARHLRFEPLVSVLIPAWNEEVGIVKTVQSVLNGTYKNVQIIVIDDGSTDNTAQWVEKAFGKEDKVTLINEGHRGKAEALNRGLKETTGEFILTLDADSYLTRRSIGDMVRTLVKNADYDVAIGEIVVGNARGGLLAAAQYFEYLVGFHYKRTQQIFQSSFIFPGALTMFRRRLLDEVGLFDNYSVTEDLNYSMRVKKSGGKVAYVDSAVCITEGAGSLRGLFNQRVRWRHGMLQCLTHDPRFVFSKSKGWYLSLIELPLALLGVLEILLFPLVFVAIAWLILSQAQYQTYMLYVIVTFWFLLLPTLVIMISAISAHGVHRQKRPRRPLFLLTPVFFAMINLIEFVALIKAVWLLMRGRKAVWQRWAREGADA